MKSSWHTRELNALPNDRNETLLDILLRLRRIAQRRRG